MGTQTHTTTATGSHSVPTYTGTPCDHRSAWITLIACQKH